jgi:uncharacterized protein (TIGR02646 family)
VRQNQELNSALRTKFPAHWNNVDVRGALIAMHGKACAYCSRLLLENYRGDVEHFRPKGVYWWLAYELSNYVMSCTLCNRTYKIDRFPLASGALPVVFEERDAISEEPRILFDPTQDRIDAWFRVDLDQPNCPIIPNPSQPKALRQRVQECIDFYRLNTSLSLVKARLEKFNLTLNAIVRVVKSGDAASIDSVRRNASRYQDHSIVVRDLVRRHAPDLNLIPDRAQELAWLVEELADDLLLAVAIQQAQGHRIPRDIDELGWALAILWTRPPRGPQKAVADVLSRKDLIAIVQPYRDQLEALRESE